MENYIQEEHYLRAKKRVEKIKGFYTHLVVYVVINCLILFFIFKGYDGKLSFWNLGSFSTVLGWGVGLAIHGMVVFGPNLMFGKQWEKKKMNQFIKEEEQYGQWE